VGGLQLGLVLMTGESPDGSHVARWSEIRDLAVQAESMGLDTVWVIDELLWRRLDQPVQGFWDGVAMAGAVAASTSRIKVGTWVMSALHRNPGVTAKVVETVDEISDGRFVFGLGAGHAWPGQAHAFGMPEDHIHARFDEALRIIVPLLRDGRADVEGTYHAARDLEHRPIGPRPGRIPLMLGGHGPKMLKLAATHADIWSAYSEQRDDVEEFVGKLSAFEAACAEVGRDPATVGKSAGISIAPVPTADTGGDAPSALTGDPEVIADAILAFEAAGFTQLEFLLQPQTPAALDAMAPIIERVRKR
jgi:alkanesulfonate monooxygenase SsuD/methylene tetrahydromethanopterin reductase-like flavin-dependent oxidoreductase (luciferase family)